MANLFGPITLVCPIRHNKPDWFWSDWHTYDSSRYQSIYSLPRCRFRDTKLQEDDVNQLKSIKLQQSKILKQKNRQHSNPRHNCVYFTKDTPANRK